MRKSNSQSIKMNNTNLVVEKLVEIRESSRTELAKLTTLNKATVSTIVQDLIDKNIVIETDKSVKTNGRSANIIQLNSNAGRIISLELQPNKIYGVINNLYGDILYEISKPVDNPHFHPYLDILLQVIDHLKANTYDSTYGIIGIGIGVYGILDKNKKIKFAPFTSWRDIDLKQIIEDYTNIETYVENEANISALSDRIAYKDHHHIVSLNIGLGVGMGIIINDKLYTGANGFAGEIGHTILHPDGNSCVCGNKGCLETYIGDNAIIRQYEELTSETVELEEFVNRYKRKCPYAMRIYSEFITNVAITINNISQTLNPKIIIINSLLVENIPESISIIKNNLYSRIMNLDLLTSSQYKSKTNILGLTHLMIQNFLNVKSYVPKEH